MFKTIIILPDGTEISSGSNSVNAIQSVTLTECVNSGDDLTLGSTCANAFEATLLSPQGGLEFVAGSEITVKKEDPTGIRTQVGVFVLEKPTRQSANTIKLTGYDRISRLDKDLATWLSGLDGWPYTLTEFAKLVCEDGCGVSFISSNVPNEDFKIDQFSRSSVTGRQIMQWLGEICCRFCRANANGEIEFAWYVDSGKSFSSSGEQYYFQNSLTYEDFEIAGIEAVQIRLADSENGALWPTTDEGTNSYMITGNPFLNSRVTEEDLPPVLANIKTALEGVRYTPCKVSIPICLDIHAGNTVTITDKNGKTITTYVMTKTQKGQQDTLECTGNYRRDSSSVVNNQSVSSAGASAAKDAFDSVTSKQLFDKLTDNGRIQGIFSQDGHWVINASVAEISNFAANIITAGILKSKDGETFYLDLDKGVLKMEASEFSVKGKTVQEIADAAGEEKAKAAVDDMSQMDVFNKLFDNGNVQGFEIKDNKLYINGALAVISNLIASAITAGILKSKDGGTYFDLDGGEIASVHSTGRKVGIKQGGIYLTNPNGEETINMYNGVIFLSDYAGNLTGFLAGMVDGVTDGLTLSCYDADLGGLAPYKMVWRTINGVKTLTGE